MDVTVWAIALIVFIVAEAATVGLVAIWFALGSLAALIAALCGGPLWLQITLFVVVAAVTLAFTRPLARKYLNPRRKATNADRLMSMSGVVRESIDNLEGRGAVYIDGKIWSARSEDGTEIEADAVVTPVRIEGVKLIVKRDNK